MKRGVDKEGCTADADPANVPPPLNVTPMSRAEKLRLRRSVKRHLWNQLGAIASALAENAKAGSVPHLKALMELGVLEKGMFETRPAVKKEKSVEALLIERWNEMQAAHAVDEQPSEGGGLVGAGPNKQASGGVDGM